MNALEIRNLTKHFPGFTLDNLNLTLPSGCIMGLVGENGAGKSTTMKLILDLLHKEGGTITVLGRDHLENPELTKEEVGVVMDEAGIPECLNTAQIGNIMKHIYKRWDGSAYEQMLGRLDLKTDKPFKDFSRGMKMKLGIAVALSHKSSLLLLDEPTSGLDPVAREEVVEILNDFTREEDHSILISSHIVSDLEKLCDYIAFLHKGRLLLCEEKDRLLSEYGILHCTAQQLAEIPGEAVLHKKETQYGVTALAVRDAVPAGLNLSPVSLEELFVFMVKDA